MTDDELAHISAKIRLREVAIKVDVVDVMTEDLKRSMLSLEVVMFNE